MSTKKCFKKQPGACKSANLWRIWWRILGQAKKFHCLRLRPVSIDGFAPFCKFGQWALTKFSQWPLTKLDKMGESGTGKKGPTEKPN